MWQGGVLTRPPHRQWRWLPQVNNTTIISPGYAPPIGYSPFGFSMMPSFFFFPVRLLVGGALEGEGGSACDALGERATHAFV